MELNESRQAASLQSLGSSGDKILTALLKQVEQLYSGQDYPKKILDVGCGQGHLLQLLQDRFPNAACSGSDYTLFDQFPQEHFKFHQQDANLDFSEDFSTYDLVISSEVIEHIENGRHFIRQLSRCLVPGGKMVLSTPNIECLTSIISFVARGYHSSFGPSCYPAHIVSYSCRDLRLVIEECQGMKPIKTGFIDHGRFPGGNFHWQDFLPFLGGKWFSDNFFVVAEKSHLKTV